VNSGRHAIVLVLGIGVLVGTQLSQALAASKSPIKGVLLATVACHECSEKHGNVTVTYGDGKKKEITSDGLCADPMLCDDRKTVVWSEMEHYHGSGAYANACLAKRKVVFRAGRAVWRIEPPGDGIIEETRVLKNVKNLALKLRKTHGPAWYTLYDLTTGKLVDEEKIQAGHEEPTKWWSADLGN